MDYTVIDLEMTGLSARSDKIIEVGAVKVRGGQIADTYGTLVNPMRPIPVEVTRLTAITDEMAACGVHEDEALERLIALIGADVIVGHNVGYDYSFLKQWAIDHRRPLELFACDTLRLARALLPGELPKKLESLCEYFQIPRTNAHRALDDAVETHRIFERLIPLAQEKSPELLVPKPLSYRAKRRTPATMHQVQRLKEFCEKHNINDEICWETLTRSEASRLQDVYFRDYGRG